jgi:hypothetical protein
MPEQIGDYEVKLHQEYLTQWAGETNFEEVWSLREACIQALSE